MFAEKVHASGGARNVSGRLPEFFPKDVHDLVNGFHFVLVGL
jgi:hypothetical protein